MSEKTEYEYNCPKCKDTGFITIKTKYKTDLAFKCNCRIKKILLQESLANGFDLGENCPTINGYIADTPDRKTAKSAAVNFLKIVKDKSVKNKNLLLLGQIGSGKTHLARAIARALMLKEPPITFAIETYSQLRNNIKDFINGKEFTDHFKDYYKSIEVLIIDEFFKYESTKEEMTAADRNNIHDIIDHRYKFGKPIIITSQLTPEIIRTIDPAIYDRLRENALAEIVFTGENNNFRKK